MGNFDDELIQALTESNNKSITESKTLIKNISHIASECFQNIINHADKPELINRTNNKPSMFIVRNIGDNYAIGSTNLIDNTKKDRFASTLKSINTLDESELKKSYYNSLPKDNSGDKKNSGFGLISIAHKSRKSLKYDFEFLNYFLSLFHFQVLLKGNNKGDEDFVYFDESENFESSKMLYKKIVEDNILILRKGDFSQQAILPLLDLIESNISANSKWHGIKKKTIYILIELLQNISKHGKEINGKKDGIFIITKNDNHLTAITGNIIDNNDTENLENHLNQLVEMNDEQLRESYNEILLKQDATTTTKSVGLGFIEIMKFGTKKLSYNFIKLNENDSFFSVCITI